MRGALGVKHKILALLLLTALLFSSACQKAEPEISDTTSAAPETTSESVPSTSAAADIVFDINKATSIGIFPSEIYGLLNIFLQDGFLLIFDDFGDLKFTLSAQSYNPNSVSGKVEMKIEDINFDGFKDFRLLYNERGSNKYYLCFLWDMEKLRFSYCHPLSALPSPEFDSGSRTVSSYDREQENICIITTYSWDRNSLIQTAKRVEEAPPLTTHA